MEPKCPPCGYSIGDSVSFCPRCGARLTSTSGGPDRTELGAALSIGCLGLVLASLGSCMALLQDAPAGGGIVVVGAVLLLVAVAIAVANSYLR